MTPTYELGDVAPMTGKVRCVQHADASDHVVVGTRFEPCTSGVAESTEECIWEYLWTLRLRPLFAPRFA